MSSYKYDPKSLKAEEFINHEEILETLSYADENSKNLRIFRKAYTYADEFTSYKDGSTDFCGYYTQDCENDARDYAEDAVSDYYWRIMDHLEE